MSASRRSASTRLTLIASFVALGIAACGGSSDIRVSSRPRQAEPTTTTTTTASLETTTTGAASSTVPSTVTPPTTLPLQPGMQFVATQGVRLQVPAGWPVYDLATATKRCVLANANAAYLGHQAKNAVCPADASGRTETVQIEPLDTTSQTRAVAATKPATINGITVRTDPASITARALTVIVPDRSALITITYRNDPSLANRILQSLEHAA